MQESVYRRREPVRRLPEDAPNILIVLIDDAGPALPTTFGGEVRTPTLDRVCGGGDRVQPVPHDGDVLADAGVAVDGPQPSSGRQRADRRAGERLGRLLGHIPRSSALVAEVLRHYGYCDRGVGQVAQHAGGGDDGRRSVRQLADRDWGSSTSTGSWPVRRRSTSRTWCATRPACCRPSTPEEGYHLSEDLADDAIGWLRTHRALDPDKPFFMYWASGCLHGPHQVMKEWADRYARRVRRRVGRLPGTGHRRRQGEGLDPRGRRADAATSADAGVGRHPRGASGRSSVG